MKKVKEKSKKNAIMMNDLHKRNDECTEKLFETREEKDLKDLPMVAFKKPKIPLLKTFIHVRMFDLTTVPSGKGSQIPSHKGTLQKSEEGVNKILRVDHDCRELPILLERPLVDDDDEVIISDKEYDEDGKVDDDQDDVNEEGSNLTRLIVECDPPPAIITPLRFILEK